MFRVESAAPSPPEFDFLVTSEFLRTSLADLIEEKSIPTEDVIDIEYVEKFPAPEPFESIVHDDWVASVHFKSKWSVHYPSQYVLTFSTM